MIQRSGIKPGARPPVLRRIGLALLTLVGAASVNGALGTPLATQTDGGLQAADSLVREWVDAENVPGAVLLVSRGGEVVLERAYGWAQLYDYQDGQYGASAAGDPRPTALRRLQDPRAMAKDTVFDLASVTKVMATTFAVMLLVDAGELELDAPVSAYLPDFATEPGGSGKADITLRHLLTHRSGLHQWKPVYYHAGDATQAYEYIRDLPLAWEVGTERHYSDLGFMLLGLVVENVSGRPLEDFLRERLYEPLGLSSTGFRPAVSQRGSGPTAEATGPPMSGPTLPYAATSHGNPYEHRMVHDADFGYRIGGDPNAWNAWRRYTLVGEVNDGNAFHAFDGSAGHAGLFSTAGDLQVLMQLLLDGGEYGGRRYISAGVVESFLAATGDEQALGWQVPDEAPPGSFVHSGFTGTYVLGVSADNLGVILLTNRQNVGVDGSGRYPDVGSLQTGLTRALTGPGQ